ncbi:MAG TPA: acyl-CoA dehydrogenase family protein [Pirellulales bacterium]|nr:acyl-CoA dehydrogenase family protein [Pirellulales bacterium]
MNPQTKTGPQGAPVDDQDNKASFAETALKLGGKSADEAGRMGALDKADDQVDDLFAKKYQTTNSPVHRAIWDRELPIELFASKAKPAPGDVERVMNDSLAVMRKHVKAGTNMDENKKVPQRVLDELGGAGYWGLLVDKKYGGSGAPFASFAAFLTRMAMVDATVAGLASVHGCIGAVDPVRTFGSAEQKERFLPELASGRRLSAFALTEPCAGSDLTALRTRADRDGNDYVVNGEKLFITNVVPGRTIGLVCLIEKRPAVLIVDLPREENENFQLRKYGLYALKHTYNQGIIFKDLRVPADNLLRPTRGDGLTIAYHGLNLGRVALCANAAGTMRLMMASMIPWAKYRRTYGATISTRELVQRRLGRLAGLVVGCDALVQWGGGLIDEGYRGEMECVIGKIFGSEAQKEASIELLMKTHGGRSFLHGHMFGDNVHEYLAPCIYEGEGEMLSMAFFKSLVKQHGVQYFEPVGKALQAAGIKKPNMSNPAHLWALRGVMVPYAKWLAGEVMRPKPRPALPAMPDALKKHVEYATTFLQKSPYEISYKTMSKHQLGLADRQCRMSELSQRLQDAVTILVTALYAANQNDEVVRQAADVLCQDLTRKITGKRPSDRYYRKVTKLGEVIADGGFTSIAGIDVGEILMRYDSN